MNDKCGRILTISNHAERADEIVRSTAKTVAAETEWYRVAGLDYRLLAVFFYCHKHLKMLT